MKSGRVGKVVGMRWIGSGFKGNIWLFDGVVMARRGFVEGLLIQGLELSCLALCLLRG